MNVTWGGAALGTFSWPTPSSNTLTNMQWKFASVTIDGSKTTGTSTVLAVDLRRPSGAYGIALDDVSVTANTSSTCNPGNGQIALFTGTSWTGDCATYGPGTYPDVSANGGIPRNSARSIKVGPGAFAGSRRSGLRR